MEELDLPLLVHGEVTDPGVDVFDREAAFIDARAAPLLVRRFPRLQVVFEHITTRDGVAFVRGARDRGSRATITPQHLLLNRNALFAGGIRPHHYCLPVLKREVAPRGADRGRDQRRAALLPRHRQRAARARTPRRPPAAAPASTRRTRRIELYAEAFDRAGRLDRLEAFASVHGADFYRLPRNTDSITLSRDALDRTGRLPVRRRYARAISRRRDDRLAPRRARRRVRRCPSST